MQSHDPHLTTRALGPGRRPFRGRHALLALAVVALLIAGIVGATTHHDRKTVSASKSGATTTIVASTSDDCPATPAKAPAGGWGVGRITLTLVDPTRPTNADTSRGLPAKPDRTFPILLTYPTAPVGGATAIVDDATPAGRFPLVLFSHGVTSNGLTISNVSTDLVRAGYVVAAPTYPLSSGDGAGIGDVFNQPADVHFMVDHLEGAVGSHFPTANPVLGHCVALAGHSLGAITTLLAGYGSCCVWTGPTAPKAVVELSGLFLQYQPHLFDNAPTTPLLLIHGDADKTVPYSGSQQVYSALSGPRWFLTLLHGSHPGVFLPPWNKVVMQAMAAFLDAQLQHSPSALDGFGSVAQASGVASWQHAG